MKDYQLDLILNRDLSLARSVAQTRQDWMRYFDMFDNTNLIFQGAILENDYVVAVLKESKKVCYGNFDKNWFCSVPRVDADYPVYFVDFYLLHGADALESLIERGMFQFNEGSLD